MQRGYEGGLGRCQGVPNSGGCGLTRDHKRNPDLASQDTIKEIKIQANKRYLWPRPLSSRSLFFPPSSSFIALLQHKSHICRSRIVISNRRTHHSHLICRLLDFELCSHVGNSHKHTSKSPDNTRSKTQDLCHARNLHKHTRRLLESTKSKTLDLQYFPTCRNFATRIFKRPTLVQEYSKCHTQRISTSKRRLDKVQNS